MGTYRLMDKAQAQAAGGFYSADEYDLTPLINTGQSLIELGRSCLHPDYRGGGALMQLWQGVARHVLAQEAEILFGVASFHGTDPAALAQPLSYLHHRHRAAEDLRVKARGAAATPMDLVADAQIDRRAALSAIPALMKAYLRLGAVVGEGAFVDHAFNTTDVCMIVETAKIDPAQRARLTA